MTTQITVYTPGEAFYTVDREGVIYAWRILDNGALALINTTPRTEQ